MILWKLSYQGFKHRPGRTFVTVAGMSLGIAAIVAVAMASVASDQAITKMKQGVSGRISLEVVTESGRPFDEGLADRLRACQGVATVIATFTHPTPVYSADARATLIATGVDPNTDIGLLGFEMAEGVWLNEKAGVVLDRRSAESLKLKVGDPIKLLGRRGMTKRTITGLFDTLNVAALTSGADCFVTLRHAQAMSAAGHKATAFKICLDENASAEQVRDRLAAMLPAGVIARVPFSHGKQMAESLLGIRYGLFVLTALTLVMAWTIVFNTFLMTVSERRKQLSTLLAIGATPRQVVRLLLNEGLIIGIVSFLVGLPLGSLSAPVITHILENLLATQLPPLRLTILPVAAALFTSASGALLACSIPALIASRISPLEGMRGDAVPIASWRSPWAATLCGLALELAGVILLIAFLKRFVPAVIMIPAAIAVLVGSVLLVPACVPWIVNGATNVLASLLGAEIRLARGNLLARRTRTFLTASALSMAISAAIGIGHIIVANTRDAREWSERVFVGDYFLRPLKLTESDIDADAIKKQLEAIGGVTSVETQSLMLGHADGRQVTYFIHDYDPDVPPPLDLRQGDPAKVVRQLKDGGVAIGTVFAERTGLKLGDTLSIERPDGASRLPIIAVVNDYAAGGLAVFLDRTVASRLWRIRGTDVFVVRSEPAAQETSRAALLDFARQQAAAAARRRGQTPDRLGAPNARGLVLGHFGSGARRRGLRHVQ